MSKTTTMLKKTIFLRLFLCSFLLFFINVIFAQEKQISGKVTDASTGKPVANTTVTLRGSKVATATNADGNFSISVPNTNARLVISSVGYEQQVVTAAQSFVQVSLKATTSSLDEVVVTGYTAQRKKDLTGAVSVIKTSDLTKVSSPSFLGQIEGRASGVATNSSGEPGSAVALRIRGNSTFTEGGGDPLIVVDGVQVRGAFQNGINPNDIESIQILKDAATTSAYGIGANNGVIIITTKKGKAGVAKIDASSYYGTQAAGGNTYDKQLITNSAEYAHLLYLTYKNAGLWPLKNNDFMSRVYGNGTEPVIPQYINPLPDVAGGPINTKYDAVNNLVMKASPGTNWWNAAFRTDAPIAEQNVSVSGGTENGGRYFLSANYFKQDGIMKYTDYNRYTVRANTEFKVKEIFTIGENLSIAFNDQVTQPGGNQVEQNILTQGILKNQPIIPIYDEGGNWGGTRSGFGGGDNALATLVRNKDNRGSGFRLLGNIYGEVAITKHISARVSFGIDHGWYFNRNYHFANPEANQIVGSGFSENVNRYFNWLFQQQLTYTNKFGNHDLKVIAVHEAKLNSFRNMSGGLSGYTNEQQSLWYINPAFGDPASRSVNTSGGRNNAKESYLGRMEYGFKGKYLVNATARYDQSSNFALAKGQLFGGVGVAWRASDEKFMQKIKWVNDLKIRAAYGVTGNDAIDPSSNYTLFGGSVGSTFYDINGTNSSTAAGYSAISAGVPVLWEKQKQYNIGIDASFFNNRLEASVDLYRRENKDFLFRPSLPGTFPFLVTAPYRNLGQISNKGVELTLNWKDDFAKDWKYSVGVNMTFNKNKIDKLAPELGIKSFFGTTPESRIGPLVRQEQGYPMGSFYGYTVGGFFQDAAEVAASKQDGAGIGKFKWKDLNGDGKIDNNDKSVIGNPNPDLVFGINLGLNYKDFDFTVFLQGTVGNQNFNYTKYFTDFNGFTGHRSKRMLYDSWTPENRNAKLPQLNALDGSSFLPSNYYIENASYLRARTVQLGYRLPKKLLSKARIDNARLYIQGQNLFTITKYSGLDPALGTRNNATEQWSGVDFGNYPTSRVIMIGLNISL